MVVVITFKRLVALLLVTVLVVGILISLRPEYQPVSSTALPKLPTLIIDPGHGGDDGGAVSVNGVCESVINMDIAKKMSVLSELMGYPVLLTRESEELIYPDECNTISKRKRFDQKQRVEFINATDNAILLSIHQNSFPSSKPYGPQAFHNSDETAVKLGVLVQEYLSSALCQGNRRMAAPVSKGIYLMKNIECPGVLCECGFVSNKKEAKLLETGEYRIKVACAIMGAYAKYISTQ